MARSKRTKALRKRNKIIIERNAKTMQEHKEEIKMMIETKRKASEYMAIENLPSKSDIKEGFGIVQISNRDAKKQHSSKIRILSKHKEPELLNEWKKQRISSYKKRTFRKVLDKT